MLVSPEALILAAVVVFAGYVVFGVTGFGASPITIPVLAQVLPLTFVLPLTAVLDLGSAVALGLHTRRQADARELVALVPFTLLGLALGVTLLVRLPRKATLLALGVFVCAYATYLVRGQGTTPQLSRHWAAPAGLAGGALGALFGIGGPPYVMYLAGRIPEPVTRRATISSMVILSVGLRVAAFGLAGLFASRALWIAVGCLLPVAWAGVWLGNRVHLRLTPTTTGRVLAAVLFLTGAALVVRAL